MAREYSLDDFVGKDLWVKSCVDSNTSNLCWVKVLQKFPNGFYECRLLTERGFEIGAEYYLDFFDALSHCFTFSPEDVELVIPIETMTSEELWASNPEAYQNYATTPDILNYACGKDLWVRTYVPSDNCDAYLNITNIADNEVTCHAVLAEIIDDPDSADIDNVIYDARHIDHTYTYDIDTLAIFERPPEYVSTNEIIDLITDIWGQDVWNME
jgi:hypothetical protein